MEQKKKKTLLGTAIMVATVVIAANLGPKLFDLKTKDAYYQNNALSERAKIMNKDCPFVIDENTRLDSVTTPSKDVLQNNYTLLNDNLADMDIGSFKNIFRPAITNHLKSNRETKFFLKNNATLIYKYFDKEKQFITDIVILPKDYQ